jgi:tRNA (guanosine-2'-O-)-methyltransferase
MPEENLVPPAWLTPERFRRLSTAASLRQLDVSLVAENISDPHNISAMMRSAEAFGIQHVEVIGQPDEFRGHPKTSSSAREWLTIGHPAGVAECFTQLRSRSQKIYVTRLDSVAKSFFDVDWTQPCAIVMGNEHSGVSDAAVELADESVYIPMAGLVQSFNVSVATAIILAELYRQRAKAGLYDGEMRENNNHLLDTWLAKEAENRGEIWPQ